MLDNECFLTKTLKTSKTAYLVEEVNVRNVNLAPLLLQFDHEQIVFHLVFNSLIVFSCVPSFYHALWIERRADGVIARVV